MDIDIKTSPKVELGVGHQFGKLIASSTAAFAAGKVTDRLYDAAVLAIRARRNNTA